MSTIIINTSPIANTAFLELKAYAIRPFYVSLNGSNGFTESDL